MVHEKDIISFDTGEIKRVNANFIQLYEDNIDLIIDIANEHPTAVKLFLFILKNMDDRNALVISQSALAEALNLHRNTIGNSITFLREKKALTILKSGNTNIYAINSEVAWKSTAKKKKYAHFTAKVYISATEQDNVKSELFAHGLNKKPKKQSVKDYQTAIDTFEKKLTKTDEGSAGKQPEKG